MEMERRAAASDHVADLLREQGATAAEVAEWAPVARRLADDWPAREVTAAETQRLLAAVAPHVPKRSPVRQARRTRSARRRGSVGRLLDLIELARTQVGILRPSFWLASAAITLLGAYIELSRVAGSSVFFLQALGPLLAFLGIQSAFRSTGLRTLEHELACPPSPLQLVVARLVIVLGYDVGLGFCLAGVLWRYSNASFLAITLHWLMPLLLVAGLALVLSLLLSSELAAGVAYAGWLAALATITLASQTHPQTALTQSPVFLVALGAVGLILLIVAAWRFPAVVPRLLPQTG